MSYLCLFVSSCVLVFVVVIVLVLCLGPVSLSLPLSFSFLAMWIDPIPLCLPVVGKVVDELDVGTLSIDIVHWIWDQVGSYTSRRRV